MTRMARTEDADRRAGACMRAAAPRRSLPPREEALLDLIYERMSRHILTQVSVRWLPAWVLAKEAAEDERARLLDEGRTPSAGGYDITDLYDLRRMADQIIIYLCAHEMLGFTASPTDPSRAPVAVPIDTGKQGGPAVDDFGKT